jgi:hypothetical protein
MRNLELPSKFGLFSSAASVIFLTVLLFSCTKNISDVQAQQNAESTSANVSSNASTRTSTVAVPFENTVFVPCANGDAGEDVSLTGKTNLVYQVTWTDQGFTFVYHDNDHQVKGVGLSSGENFTGSGGTNGTFSGSWVNSKWEGSFVEETKVIGKNTVFTVIQKLHLIVTPDGNVVVNNVEQTVTCQ